MTTTEGKELAHNEVIDGEIVASTSDYANEDEAIKAVRQIKQADTMLWNRIVEAYNRRIWLALGHDSWKEFCDSELDGMRFAPRKEQRADTVKQLIDGSGMSSHAISAVTGMSASTVQRTIRKLAQEDEKYASLVVGSDGRTQNRSSESRSRSQSKPKAKSGSVEVTAPEIPTWALELVPSYFDVSPEHAQWVGAMISNPELTDRDIRRMYGSDDTTTDSVSEVRQRFVAHGGAVVAEIGRAAHALAERVESYLDEGFDARRLERAGTALHRAQDAIGTALLKLSASVDDSADADGSE